MTSSTNTPARRKELFSRTLVLTALFVVAAASGVFCSRAARADEPSAAPRKTGVPVPVTPETQAVAGFLAAQASGNLAAGASLMQVLWDGGKTDDPNKSQSGTHTTQSAHRHAGSHRTNPQRR